MWELENNKIERTLMLKLDVVSAFLKKLSSYHVKIWMSTNKEALFSKFGMIFLRVDMTRKETLKQETSFDDYS